MNVFPFFHKTIFFYFMSWPWSHCSWNIKSRIKHHLFFHFILGIYMLIGAMTASKATAVTSQVMKEPGKDIEASHRVNVRFFSSLNCQFMCFVNFSLVIGQAAPTDWHIHVMKDLAVLRCLFTAFLLSLWARIGVFFCTSPKTPCQLVPTTPTSKHSC